MRSYLQAKVRRNFSADGIATMILATHAVIGGTIGRLLPESSGFAFALGFISHFAADAIPHWAYRLRSLSEDKGGGPLSKDMRFGKDFAIDLMKIGADVEFGFAVLFLL